MRPIQNYKFQKFRMTAIVLKYLVCCQNHPHITGAGCEKEQSDENRFTFYSFIQKDACLSMCNLCMMAQSIRTELTVCHPLIKYH